MTKVLIITYYWPPGGGAGVQRWLKFVKYMRVYGYEPIVYTALNGEMPVIDRSLEKDVPEGITILRRSIWEPYSVYKRFIGRKKDDKINASFLNEGRKVGFAEKLSVWIRGNFFIPDARRFWIKPSIRFLNRFIQKEKIGFVISSGPPHSMHLIARGLKRKNPTIKWLADFRDPWTNIDFYSKLMLSPLADAKHHRLEQSVLQESDVVVSIGKGMSEELQAICIKSGGQTNGRFEVITNGFDEEDLSKVPVKLDVKFSLAHIGTLVKDRNAEVLWKALSELVTEHAEFASALELKLVGKIDVFVTEQIQQYGLSSYVRKIDYLPHDAVISEQQASAVLLLLVNNTANAKGILTGKFFEYMASGRPVLAIGPVDGDLAEIMQSTQCGYISGFEDKLQLKNNLLQLFANQLPKRNENRISEYSRKALTKKLCSLLDAL